VGDKIVSHDGVSGRTTGNLQLAGDYEEFGEVQEKREVEGDSITLHGDVFGKVVSRGGTILLNRNLVGGTALNKCGDIVVNGVASGALIQSSSGEVTLQRAENCVVSATRVRIEHAINCEIVGLEVRLGVAEGCAVAARQLLIESAGPRRQSDMVAIVQVPDCARLDQVIGATRERVAQLAELAAQHKDALDQLAVQPDVRKYMRLATGVRKNEITLTPEQLPAFQRMAQAVGPTLKEIGKLSTLVKSIEAERAQGLELAARLETQREQAGNSRVELLSVQGDVQVRTLLYTPDGSSTFDLQPREIKTLLRGNPGTSLLFSGNSGAFSWDSDCPDGMMSPQKH
jgi:hypothetical protein